MLVLPAVYYLTVVDGTEVSKSVAIRAVVSPELAIQDIVSSGNFRYHKKNTISSMRANDYWVSKAPHDSEAA